MGGVGRSCCKETFMKGVERAVATILHRVNGRVCQHTFLIVRMSVFRILPYLEMGSCFSSEEKISEPQSDSQHSRVQFSSFFFFQSVSRLCQRQNISLSPDSLVLYFSLCFFLLLFSLPCREE